MPTIVGVILVRSCRNYLLHTPYMVEDERGNRKRFLFVCFPKQKEKLLLPEFHLKV